MYHLDVWYSSSDGESAHLNDFVILNETVMSERVSYCTVKVLQVHESAEKTYCTYVSNRINLMSKRLIATFRESLTAKKKKIGQFSENG
jgi:hypothetical protein